ncbi:MAG: hypothetical protein M3198_05785 [Actinomycetota bacterium]|nr:hypothetical protein [Actinomycetota bacterium]
MAARKWIRALAWVGASVCALVGGHLLQYRLLIPDPVARAHLLAETGHGYLPSAVRVSILLGLLAGGAAVLLGYSSKRQHEAPGGVAAKFGLRAAGVQMSCFVCLEVIERVVAGASVGHLLGRPILLALLVQFLGAALATVALWMFERFGALVAAAPGSKRPRSTRDDSWALPRALQPAFTLFGSPSVPRGPPTYVLS